MNGSDKIADRRKRVDEFSRERLDNILDDEASKSKCENPPELLDVVIVPRSSVMRFSIRMEERLSANDFKGGWSRKGFDFLFLSLLDNVHELDELLHVNLVALNQEETKILHKKVMGKCADIANFAMMMDDTIENFSAELSAHEGTGT